MNTELKSTTNYDLFEPYEVNRNVNEEGKKFRKLVESMRKHGFISAYPLHCIPNGNGKLKIKAGHHRLRAAQKLNMPVWYIVSHDGASIQELESAGPGKWATHDYFVSYCKQGIVSYLLVKDFINRTGISLHNAVSMFDGETAGSNNFTRRNAFYEGKFEVKDVTHPETVGDIVIHLRKLGIKWAAQNNMVRALSRVVKLPQFEIHRFKQKAESHKPLLEKQKNLHGFLEMIERVYNYKVPKSDKVNIAFLAQEEAASRSITSR